MSNSYYSKNKPQQEQHHESAECYECLRSEISEMGIKTLMDIIEQSARQGDDYYRRLADPTNELTMTDELKAIYRDRCNLFIGLHDMATDELKRRVDLFLACKRDQEERERTDC